MGFQVLYNSLPSFASGGNTSVENNPQQDGDDGTSFFGHQGEIFLYPLKGNDKSSDLKQTNKSLIFKLWWQRELIVSIMVKSCEGVYFASSLCCK